MAAVLALMDWVALSDWQWRADRTLDHRAADQPGSPGRDNQMFLAGVLWMMPRDAP